MSGLSEKELGDFFEFLRFDSVSTRQENRARCVKCAEWVKSYFERSGLEAELRDTGCLPVVVAKNQHLPGRPTVLVYGHYDVQPEDPLDLWESQPFEPLLRDGVVYARGATDNKGQIYAHMLGWRRHFSGGEAPVNVIFLVEGEEEIGSPNLASFLEKYREEFRCDAVVLSDTGMLGENVPTLTYGLRGIAALELTLRGPERDLHSGIFGGAVLNPLLVLSKMLAALHDDSGRVTIPGFYDGVRAVEPWELEAWARLPLTEERICELTGVPALWGEMGYSVLERMWARPTAEVNGMWGGYLGAGSKTIIPAEAHAKLTFRLVPEQDPQSVLSAAEDFLRNLCPAACRLELRRGHSGRAYFLNPRGRLGEAAVAALRDAGGDQASGPALICEGGSVPIVSDFERILGASSILLGLALPDCRIHSPNENFHLSVLEYGTRLHACMLRRLAAVVL
jgi:acetylornithine deacetylase/succinyl-diaminopimelate desuccinylase-like protein